MFSDLLIISLFLFAGSTLFGAGANKGTGLFGAGQKSSALFGQKTTTTTPGFQGQINKLTL